MCFIVPSTCVPRRKYLRTRVYLLSIASNSQLIRDKDKRFERKLSRGGARGIFNWVYKNGMKTQTGAA